MSNADRQPSELGELKKIVNEFVSRYKTIEGEIDLLKEQRTDLIDEFKDKLDMKTLKAALRAVKIKNKVQHKDTFDTFVEILERENVI